MPAPRDRDKRGNLVEDEKNSQANLDKTLDELEHKIDRVRTLYEQYFMGIEKMEPLVARKECTRLILGLAQQHIRNTGARFRFHSLQQKWNIYVTYWNRTMREIEAGTYRRDVARLTRKVDREGGEITEEAAFELGLVGKNRNLRRRLGRPGTRTPGKGVPAPEAAQGTPGAEAAAPAVAGQAQAAKAPAAGGPPPVPGAARRPAPPTPNSAILPAGPPAFRLPTLPPGMNEQAMREVYTKYVAAKRQLGSSDAVTIETLATTLSKQSHQIIEKHACKSVDYDVQVRDGKVVLRPIAKR